MSNILDVARPETQPASVPHTQRPSSTKTTESQALRLRHAVSSRSIQGRGVAISSGSTAVVINGNAAEKLWQYLEPRLRAGTTRPELTSALPETVATTVLGLLEELGAHDLLCFVEEPADPDETLPGLAHFEKTAKHPMAAARRMARTELMLTASDSVLLEECTTALEEAGFNLIGRSLPWQQDPESIPDMPSGTEVAVLQMLGASGWEIAAVALESCGWRVVGPTSGHFDAKQWPMLLGWARQQSAGSRAQHPAVSRLGSKLAATQLALAAMAAMEPERETSVFMVTNPDVVSEPHPLFGLAPVQGAPHPENLNSVWDDRALAAALDSPQPDPSDALPGYEELWRGVINPWNGPAPMNLGQLPLGAAQAGLAGANSQDIAEIGLSTASARINALESLATLWASAPGPGWTRHAGHTGLAAVAASAMHAMDKKSGWVHESELGPQFTARSRRLWSALTLRFGIDATLQVESWRGGHTPLFRVTVLDPAARPIGRGIAPQPESALEEALIRAVGATQIAADEHAKELAAPAALGMELAETRRSMTRWVAAHREQLGISIHTPEHTERWLQAGLHVVDIRWEETQ